MVLIDHETQKVQTIAHKGTHINYHSTHFLSTHIKKSGP